MPYSALGGMILARARKHMSMSLHYRRLIMALPFGLDGTDETWKSSKSVSKRWRIFLTQEYINLKAFETNKLAIMQDHDVIQ